MAENNGKKGFLGVTIPRREPVGDTDTGSAQRKAGLVGLHPLAKRATDYAELILARLDDIKDASTKKQTRLSMKKASVTNTTGGAADVGVLFDGPPPGVSWEIMRIITDVAPLAATKARVYLNAVSPLNKLQVVADASDYSDAPAGVLYVPGGQKLLVQFIALANNAQATVVLQVREFINPPVLEIG